MRFIYEPTLKVVFTPILWKKQSRVCDLSAACVLLHYSFLCFAMGEVYASLIKSVPHSGGFYSAARMEGGGGQRRERGGREIVQDLTFLCDAGNSSAVGSAAPVRRSLLLGHQRFHRIVLWMPPERLRLLFKQ